MFDIMPSIKMCKQMVLKDQVKLNYHNSLFFFLIKGLERWLGEESAYCARMRTRVQVPCTYIKCWVWQERSIITPALSQKVSWRVTEKDTMVSISGLYTCLKLYTHVYATYIYYYLKSGLLIANL